MTWIVYYLLLVLIFISGIICVVKKKKSGLFTTILTPIFAIWIFIYWLHRDWVNGQTEFVYFIEEINKLSLEAILILLLFIVLIILFIYNIVILIKEKKHEK